MFCVTNETRCGVELLIRHKVKLSALSHNETHTSAKNNMETTLNDNIVLCAGGLVHGLFRYFSIQQVNWLSSSFPIVSSASQLADFTLACPTF